MACHSSPYVCESRGVNACVHKNKCRGIGCLTSPKQKLTEPATSNVRIVVLIKTETSVKLWAWLYFIYTYTMVSCDSILTTGIAYQMFFFLTTEIKIFCSDQTILISVVRNEHTTEQSDHLASFILKIWSRKILSSSSSGNANCSRVGNASRLSSLFEN